MSRFRLILDPPPLIGDNGIANWSIQLAIQRHVAAVLEYTGGDQGWASSELGVNPSTLYRWLREYRGSRVRSRMRFTNTLRVLNCSRCNGELPQPARSPAERQRITDMLSRPTWPVGR